MSSDQHRHDNEPSNNPGHPPVLMEAYPFQKRLAEIMVAEVETCLPATPARQVARRMVEGR